MLARIESGFARERQFTANASHELRTPLTVMQTILGFVREGERSAQEYRQALTTLPRPTACRWWKTCCRCAAKDWICTGEIDLALLLADVNSLRSLAECLELICSHPHLWSFPAIPDQLIVWCQPAGQHIWLPSADRSPCRRGGMGSDHQVAASIGIRRTIATFERFLWSSLPVHPAGRGWGCPLPGRLYRHTAAGSKSRVYRMGERNSPSIYRFECNPYVGEVLKSSTEGGSSTGRVNTNRLPPSGPGSNQILPPSPRLPPAEGQPNPGPPWPPGWGPG
jgi:hypothetical protein